jgi:hypothetical protein
MEQKAQMYPHWQLDSHRLQRVKNWQLVDSLLSLVVVSAASLVCVVEVAQVRPQVKTPRRVSALRLLTRHHHRSLENRPRAKYQEAHFCEHVHQPHLLL